MRNVILEKTLKPTILSTGFVWERKGNSFVRPASKPTSIETKNPNLYAPKWFHLLNKWESHQAKIAKKEKESVSKYIDPSGALLEVGSCCGSFSFELLQSYPNKVLYLIEPEAKNIEYLSRRFASNTKVHILPVAIGSTTELKTLYINPQEPGTHTFTESLVSSSHEVSDVLTPIVNGSELLGGIPGAIRQISTIYIDNGGMEYQAIDGLLKAITDPRYKGRPTIIINNNYGNTVSPALATKVAAILFGIGYIPFDFPAALTDNDHIVFVPHVARRGM